MAEPRRLLILGGTGEAAALCRRIAGDPGFAVTVSFAGRTRAPAAVPGRVRHGGFGGAEGLKRYLAAQAIDLVLDATHPYAARITENAAAACATLDVPRLLLLRPPWRATPGDRWIPASDAAAAAGLLLEYGRRVFLAIGRQQLDAFAHLPDHWFLVRSVEPPETPLRFARYGLVLARGPFIAEKERALLRENGISAVVSRNSGGLATYGKIEAARSLGLPVIMLERPPVPTGETAASVDAALAWLHK